ncbi:MAG TPA: bifunctional phosphoribosylaminoimidazolecarboxamide formyltransferase/IMP cyclohydrolase [Candidatus Krumholzibacteriaceae bacterium]|nr:bifunctional phosphoribosylaminoimidazolecarboxamide formyltransferase/IMP cyclohydrolase [Candidatus Krumholzibacteriaceae bacterium]
MKRVLISVTDKRGIVEFAGKLSGMEIEIIASGGTALALRDARIDVTDISNVTGFPEIMDGRIKTLHPMVHGGILADRSRDTHIREAKDLDIEMIDMVVVNLYKFREAASNPRLSKREVVEKIDIGGPTLIRSAAKNYHSVTVIVDPADYDDVIEYLAGAGGDIPLDARRGYASKAFHHTASYDAAISNYFDSLKEGEIFPEQRVLSFRKLRLLRYGENPHLKAALYEKDSQDEYLADFQKLQGKELSFNNIMDMYSAFMLSKDIGYASCTVNKHMNPCGAAACGEPYESFVRARKTDPMSAFGSVVAVNGVVDERLAKAACEGFIELLLSRGFTDSAREILSKKKNLRLIVIPDSEWEKEIRGTDVKEAGKLVLVQESDTGFKELDSLNFVTSRKPGNDELRSLKLAWKIVKHIKSNAIVICDRDGTIGVGAGQMSRVDSCRISVEKARSNGIDIEGASAASDAFFPFPDGVEVLVEAGVRSVIQPGGSIRDKKVIKAAEEMGITMAMTGTRHFKH